MAEGPLHLRPWRTGDESVLLEAAAGPEAQRRGPLPSPCSAGRPHLADGDDGRPGRGLAPDLAGLRHQPLRAR